MKSRFKIKGLDCANCAAELERAIEKIDGIDNVSMELEFEDVKKEEIMKKLNKVIKREEPDVKIEEV